MGWIEDNFRSKRGLLRELTSRVKLRFEPNGCSHVDLARVQRLVFVCKGNICRSAFAEGVALVNRFPACSYGLETTPGKGADPGMLAAARELGIELVEHRTERFSSYRAEPQDLVLFFEEAHLQSSSRDLESVAEYALLGRWTVPRQTNIIDPYGGTPAFYLKTARQIQQSVEGLLRDLRGGHGR